jgi:hypothetical protein
MTEEQIENIFSYHAPTEEEREVYEAINTEFQRTAKLINELMPNGPGATVAIRKLSEARMAANQAVALKGTF